MRWNLGQLSEYNRAVSQAFVEAEGDCEERGISAFPVSEVHKIALLDMRLGNCDRNGGDHPFWSANMLGTVPKCSLDAQSSAEHGASSSCLVCICTLHVRGSM